MDNSEKNEEKTVTDLFKKPAEIPISAIDEEAVGREARERAKQQPVLQRILKSLSKGDGKLRELIISRNFSETQLAMLVNGRLEDFEVERADVKNWVGAIFKGRIQKLESGLKAAFVITGQEKNAFLHYWDMLPAANDSFEIVSKRSRQGEITLNDIPQMYPVGAEILVQVTKAQIGTKGPRVTTNIALPGRYLVLTPFNDECGISRKIDNIKERERLKAILRRLTLPSGMGIVIRTAGAEKKLKYFVRDLSLLLKEWNAIAERAEKASEPCLLHQEPDLIGRAVRDFLTEDIDRIVTDSLDAHAEILEVIHEAASRMHNRVVLYEEATPIFEKFNVEKQILQVFSRRVPLSSGGEIVIEETEAFTAIDVNTGSHKAKKDEMENFILQVNLEAATEIVRQIHLRNLGGLIIIDFIDMKNRGDQKTVFDRMQNLLAKDTERFQVLPISPLGIMQISRQRHSQSLFRDMRRFCPYCDGRGTLESTQTTAIRLQRKLLALLKRHREKGSRDVLPLRVTIHPEVLQVLKDSSIELLSEIEATYAASLTFSSNPNVHRENFDIAHAVSGESLLP